MISKVFTPEKQEQPKSQGIKTYPPPEQRHIQDSKPKKSPYRKTDHPAGCFYHDAPFTKESKKHMHSETTNNLHYAKEKKFRNDQSDILNTNKPLMTRQQVKSDLISSDFSWNTPNYKGEPKTVVNEKAAFDGQYYKNRRLDEYLSTAIPAQSLEKASLSLSQSPHRNHHERGVNQRYSNLFDRPLGTPDIVGGKMKTISPSMDWTNYDSIRNKQDYNDE